MRSRLPIVGILLAGCASAGSAPPPQPPEVAVSVAEVARTEAGGPDCVAHVEQLGLTPDPRLYGDDVVVVRKSARRLMHFERGALVPGQCYRVGLGQGAEASVGTKVREGDRKTPEGWYRTSDKPTSRYYGAIAVHYPNLDDATAGRLAGLIDDRQLATVRDALARDGKPPQDTPLGGEILIHGGGAATDWTLGCIALDDRELDALRASLPPDQRFDVLVLP